MQSKMEMIYVGNGKGYKTGVGAIFETNAATYAAFRAAKPLDVGLDDAVFLLDYYNRKGDLAGSIGLSPDGFEEIVGEAAPTEAQCKKFDTQYWDDARARPNAGA